MSGNSRYRDYCHSRGLTCDRGLSPRPDREPSGWCPVRHGP
ncbi:hypothetical protein ACFPM0_05475 [Pseudonocardia sulfidoxydans]